MYMYVKVKDRSFKSTVCIHICTLVRKSFKEFFIFYKHVFNLFFTSQHLFILISFMELHPS